ncbi:MAG TPA: hypothetical protein VN660_10820 [Steroidobacteraceae bacterium]|nr:hypothetical protein [Steroidobacteraceae bacterium]
MNSPGVDRHKSRCRSIAGHGASAIILASLLLPGCSRHDAAPASSSAAGGSSIPLSSAQRGARPPGATLAVAGTLFNGSDPDQIRAYLRTVREITPTKFDVQWSPATVAVSKDEAMRALLAVSRDGSTFRFVGSEPVVASIKPGSILWVYDIAVRHVDSVGTAGAITVVHTSPASLTQAFTNADIEFNGAPNLADYYTGYRPHLVPARTAATGRRGPPAGLLPALWASDTELMPSLRRVKDEPAPGAPDGSGAGNQNDDDPDGDYGETRPLGDAHSGESLGFEYSMAYATQPDGATLYLEARKKDDGDPEQMEDKLEDAEKEAADDERDLQKNLKKLADLDASLKTDQASVADMDLQYQKQLSFLQGKGDAAGQQALTQQYQQGRGKLQDQISALNKVRDSVAAIKQQDEEKLQKLKEVGGKLAGLFSIISDNLDVRFKARADVSNFQVAGALKIVDGDLDSARAQFSNMQGKIHVDFVGRWGKPGNGAVKVPVMHLPYVFNIPFPVGGFPLVIQLGTDFSANVFLAGDHAAQQFSGDYVFSGSTGFTATRAGATDTASMSGDEPAVSTALANSPGVSGLVLAIEAPRLGLGVGVFGASSVAYSNIVSVVTMVNSAAMSTGIMLTPPCSRTTYSTYGSVGVDTQVMPLPIAFVADVVSKKLSTQKQVFEHTHEVLNPPVKGCEVGHS